MMKPTRLGWGAACMAALTLLTAASTGNNLLYLLYSSLCGLLAYCAWAGKRNLKRLAVEVREPEQAYQGQAARLTVKLTNAGAWSSYGIEVAWQESSARLTGLGPGVTAQVEVKGVLPHRGINELTDLVMESSFPLALFRFRADFAGARLLALPRPKPVREASEVADQSRATGRPTTRKGSGDELYGVREHAAGDDARIMNWKLSARLGRPLVNEYCTSHDDRITVSVDASRGAAGERAVERAASACRFHVDAGAEVRLQSAEETVDYGRGLLHLDRLLKALARLGDGRSPRPSGPAPSAAWRPDDSPALRRLTLFGVTLLFAGLFLIDEVEPAMLYVLSPLLPLSWAVQERGWHVLPDKAWHALSVLVLLFTTGYEWRAVGVTVANVHLLLYLLLNRALNPLRREELGQVFLVLYLAFFLTSGLTISLWYFAYFLAYAAFAAAWLSLASGLRWEEKGRWARGLGAGLASTALAGLALFTVTPRTEGLRRINPFLAAGIDKLSVQNSAVSAFTEDVTLGFYGRLKKSSARVLRVKPVPSPMIPAAEVHVRGSSFDRFDGRRWSRSSVDFGFTQAGRRYQSARGRAAASSGGGKRLVFPASLPPAGHPVYEMQIYPMNLGVVFTVGTPATIEGADQKAWFDHTDSVQFVSSYHGGTRYTVVPSVDAGFGARWPGYETSIARLFLQLPPDPTGRVAALSREAVGEARTPEEKARAIESFLRRRYDYSLYSDGKSVTLEDFLFKSRKGNCEYFATAGVILMRHAGVPARLVSGFLATEWNGYGKFYDVRQSEAHGWAEAYVPGRGWLTVDPTPPQSLFAERAERFGRRMERLFSAMETAWFRHVIGYDQSVQRDTFRRIGAAFSPKFMKGLARGAAWALGLAGALWGLWWACGEARRRLRAAPPTIFALAEQALAKAGHHRAAHMTEREFAASVAAARPELALVGELAELRYLERFSRAGLGGAGASRSQALLEELRRRLIGYTERHG